MRATILFALLLTGCLPESAVVGPPDYQQHWEEYWQEWSGEIYTGQCEYFNDYDYTGHYSCPPGYVDMEHG